MINLKFLNEALSKVSSDEFAVLYFIANTMSLKKESRTRIYREMVAEKLGWLNEKRPEYALKKVTNITNSLVEKGWLIKEEVFISPQKSINFYTLGTQKIGEKLPTSTQKNIPLNKSEKEVIKSNKNKKEEIKGNKEDIKKEFEEACKSEIDWEEELDIIEEQINTTSNENEIRPIVLKFNRLKNTYGFPKEFEERLEKINNIIISKVYT